MCHRFPFAFRDAVFFIHQQELNFHDLIGAVEECIDHARVKLRASSFTQNVKTFLAAAHRLSPTLRGAALETAAAAAKASGADALDDPMLTSSYQYYRNPNVFSGHSIMVTQAFPLWGKLSLRRMSWTAVISCARLARASEIAFGKDFISGPFRHPAEQQAFRIPIKHPAHGHCADCG